MNLRNGSTGQNVQTLQTRLVQKGYKLTIDGIFGSATEIAVMSFQSRNGLEADGVAGEKTLKALGLFQAETNSFRGETPSGKKIVLVSAGHSTVPPRDPGATGNGYVEAVEAVKLRDSIATRLRAKGLIVLEDGIDGESDPLKKAIQLARKAKVAIEFHFNGSDSLTATGIEVLAKKNNRVLAQRIAGAIADATGLPLRGNRGYKPDDSGQHERLGFCEAGGLVIETCFISNRNDMRAYSQNFDKIAENISNVLSG